MSKFALEHRESTRKFTYYLIGLSVSAIGFVVYTTQNSLMSFTMIPLGISILCWGFSVYFGLKYQLHAMNLLRLFSERELIQTGTHPDIGNNLEDVSWATTSLNELAEGFSNKGGDKFKWQERLFYSGIIFYLVWHILEMIIRTYC